MKPVHDTVQQETFHDFTKAGGERNRPKPCGVRLRDGDNGAGSLGLSYTTVAEAEIVEVQ